MNSVNLFPAAVGSFNIGRTFTDAEISFIQNQEMRINTGNASSMNNYILERDELTSIKSFIAESVSSYFKSVYDPKNDVKLRITQSWCNYTKPGQFHHKHAHPNSFLSGVFYIQTNDALDKIHFYKDEWSQISFPPNSWNQWNSDSWWLEASQGSLYIFPSDLQHMVQTVAGDQTRISLSFNTFPVGYIGEEISLAGLHLS